MSKKEEIIFDLELQIDWLREHKPPGWYCTTDAMKRAVRMLLEADNALA